MPWGTGTAGWRNNSVSAAGFLISGGMIIYTANTQPHNMPPPKPQARKMLHAYAYRYVRTYVYAYKICIRTVCTVGARHTSMASPVGRRKSPNAKLPHWGHDITYWINQPPHEWYHVWIKRKLTTYTGSKRNLPSSFCMTIVILGLLGIVTAEVLLDRQTPKASFGSIALSSITTMSLKHLRMSVDSNLTASISER